MSWPTKIQDPPQQCMLVEAISNLTKIAHDVTLNNKHTITYFNSSELSSISNISPPSLPPFAPLGTNNSSSSSSPSKEILADLFSLWLPLLSSNNDSAGE